MEALLADLDALDTGALFSPCRRWRYLLWRRWDSSKGICAFIGLNPSTADETQDDPTIRRCIRFAKDWGYGQLWMLNAYAFRATDPKVMKAQGGNALGPQNNGYIVAAAGWADIVVAAWGAHCDPQRERDIATVVGSRNMRLHVLGFTKDGHPRHPLYVPADTQPIFWLYGQPRR
jgi:hypothetical protein